MNDVSETLCLVDELKKIKAAKEYAEKIVSYMTTFSGSIVHELRTPLAVIQLYTELWENACKEMLDSVAPQHKETITNCVHTIKQTIKAANFLISNLLTQAKGVANGKVDSQHFEHCSIAANIEEVLQHYPFQANEREFITLVSDQDFKYVGNLILTNHILFNLMKNSLRAIHEAGKGKITIILKNGKRFNELVFSDTALGIDQDFLPKVFDQFSSQATAHGGTGLGLTFCKMIMQSYDGKIACRSEKGKYTEVILKFPRLSTL